MLCRLQCSQHKRTRYALDMPAMGTRAVSKAASALLRYDTDERARKGGCQVWLGSSCQAAGTLARAAARGCVQS